MKLPLLLICVLFVFSAVFAQDETTTHNFTDEEIALIEEIQAVNQYLNELPYIEIDTVEMYYQVTDYDGETFYQIKESVLSGVLVKQDGIVTALQADILDNQTEADLSWTLGLSTIFVDDELYLNITESGGYYSPGWVKLSDNPELQAIVGETDVQSFFEDAYRLLISDVAHIELVDVPEELETEREIVRAISMDYVPDALDAEGMVEWALYAMLEEISPQEVEGMIPQVATEISMSVIFYLDADGQLVQTDSTTSFSGDFAQVFEMEQFFLTQDLHATYRYIYLDEAPIITAPELD